MPRLLRMPGISADAEEVVFLEWCSTVGSTVAAGAAIATVETEKANVDIEAEEEAVPVSYTHLTLPTTPYV